MFSVIEFSYDGVSLITQDLKSDNLTKIPSVHEPAINTEAWQGGMTDIMGRSWKDKKVSVVGLGKSGKAAARLLQRIGADVYATDTGDTAVLQALAGELINSGIEVELGSHSESSIIESNVVVISPGVKESSLPVQWALQHDIQIISEIELAYLFCPSPIVAVTGTNGKSTTVTLIAKILQASGRAAVACGNLGLPFSSVIHSLTPVTIAVVEISSFQLIWCDRFRPNIGVLLNLGTNHLDRHENLEAYHLAKGRLFQSQENNDWAVLNGTDEQVIALSKYIQSQRIWFGDNKDNLPDSILMESTLNALNPSEQAALQVTRLLGVPDPLSWQVMRAFYGLEHRLESVRTVRGIHFINDSKSTTPDSILFAMEQVSGDVVLIIGGKDKGLAFEDITNVLSEKRVRACVCIGEMRFRLCELFKDVENTPILACETLELAVKTSIDLAGAGTTVLLSPGCASFDMFRNFEARGKEFKEIISRFEKSFKI